MRHFIFTFSTEGGIAYKQRLTYVVEGLKVIAQLTHTNSYISSNPNKIIPTKL